MRQRLVHGLICSAKPHERECVAANRCIASFSSSTESGSGERAAAIMRLIALSTPGSVSVFSSIVAWQQVDCVVCSRLRNVLEIYVVDFNVRKR
jgi:hypothetical protein